MNVLGLRDDGRDLLLAAALGSPHHAIEAWTRWMSACDGRADPVADRWLPLIAVNLHDADLDAPSRRRLNDARRQAWAFNARVRAAAAPVLDALAAASIPTMLIKGAALEKVVYPQPGMRLLGDIDVLVPRTLAIAARALMRDMGWIPGRHLDARDTTLVHGLNYSRSPYGEVDLHWNLLRECCWPDVDSGVWTRASQASVDAHTVLVPSPEDLLLHACVHGLRWSPVHSAQWIADAYYIIQRVGDRLNWQVVIDEACHRRLAFQVRQSLAFIGRVTAARVPLHVLHALGTSRWAIGERFECQVKGLPPSSLGGVYALWCDWRRTRWHPSAETPTLRRYLRVTIGNDSVRQMAPRVCRWFVRALRARRPPVSGASSRPEIQRSPAP